MEKPLDLEFDPVTRTWVHRRRRGHGLKGALLNAARQTAEGAHRLGSDIAKAEGASRRAYNSPQGRKVRGYLDNLSDNVLGTNYGPFEQPAPPRRSRPRRRRRG